MARTVRQTAFILSELYEETFSSESYEKFRITWSDLRGIAGVARLTSRYLGKVNQALSETGYTLISLDNFLVVAQETDLSDIRLVPPRIVEEYLYEEETDPDVDYDEDDEIEIGGDEVGNSEDCGIDGDDVK
jgi:hypothetical protein